MAEKRLRMVKNKVNTKTDSTKNTNNTKKKSRFLTTFICIFVGIVLVVAAVMAVMIGVRNARAFVRYDNVTMDEGVVNFFSSRFKDLYLDGIVGGKDTEEFWSSECEEGVTHGERLSEQFERYLSDIAVANRLFYRYSSLSIADEECIARSVKWVLDLRAGGSVSEFNKAVSDYGFDYDDFVVGTEMLYKAEKAQAVIYGANGENLAADTESTQCMDYLSNYAHVALVFISTEYKNELNTTTGRYEQVLIGNAERAARLEKIAEIDTLITNYMEGTGDRYITTDDFERYLGSYECDPDMKEIGYYLRRGTEYTEQFYERFAPVVDKALEMEIGDYARVDLNVPSVDGDNGFVGTCFIYRYDAQWGAWLNEDNLFLSDFLSLASDYYYSESLEILGDEVIFTDRFREQTSAVDAPRNKDFYVKTWRKE